MVLRRDVSFLQTGFHFFLLPKSCFRNIRKISRNTSNPISNNAPSPLFRNFVRFIFTLTSVEYKTKQTPTVLCFLLSLTGLKKEQLWFPLERPTIVTFEVGHKCDYLHLESVNSVNRSQHAVRKNNASETIVLRVVQLCHVEEFVRHHFC